MSKTGRLTCFALALCQIAVGCRGSQRSTDAAADPASAAKTEILIQLNERSTKIVDFTVAGVRCSERCDQPDAPTQPYRLQMRSPGYFRIELPADQALIAFDGKALLSVDHRHRTQQRIDLGSGDQSLNATLPYQALNPFLVEGWRAPLLAVAATELRGHLENAGGHRIYVLERPLQDEQLDRVEYWFRLPRADFVKKRFVKKDGQALKSVEVDSEHLDPRTGYAFPKSWRSLDQAGAVVGFNRLSEVTVNAGVAMTAFAVTVPAGYTTVAPTP